MLLFKSRQVRGVRVFLDLFWNQDKWAVPPTRVAPLLIFFFKRGICQQGRPPIFLRPGLPFILDAHVALFLFVRLGRPLNFPVQVVPSFSAKVVVHFQVVSVCFPPGRP